MCTREPRLWNQNLVTVFIPHQPILVTVSIPTNPFFDKTKCRFTHPTQTTRIKTRSMLYSCINKKHERSKTCVRWSQKYETRILKLNPYVRASQTTLFPHLKKNKQPHSFYNANREKQKRNWESMLYYKQKEKVMAG